MNPTQQMIKRLFLSIAISVAALIAGAGSAAADVTFCDGDLLTGTYDTVIVPEGANCEVVFAKVTVQNVIVQKDAMLLVDDSTFTVNDSLNGDALIGTRIPNSAVFINGNVTITGSSGFALLGVNILGHLHISGFKDSSPFGFTVENSTITRDVLIQNNNPNVRIRFVNNQVVDDIECKQKTPSLTWRGNRVSGKIKGDCLININ